jgi:hypothetical protein
MKNCPEKINFLFILDKIFSLGIFHLFILENVEKKHDDVGATNLQFFRLKITESN